MSRRKKTGRRQKAKAISAFGLRSVEAHYETAPLYQRKFQEADLMWLADEYQVQRSADPSLTFENFAAQYGLSLDDLPGHIKESMNDEIDYSITLWHGTTASRAKSIREQGFSVLGGRKGIYFTRSRSLARAYAQGRAERENDNPALVMCSIDPRRYGEYSQASHTVFVFRCKHIDSDVVRRVVRFGKEPRDKPEKLKDKSGESTNVALAFNSGRAGIALWINNYLKLDGMDEIGGEHEAVRRIKGWLDAQAAAGRFGEVSDEEMQEQVKRCLPEYLS